MKNTPNLELLRDAYMIIDGIPSKQFRLQKTFVLNGHQFEASCNTIACAAGWLSLHPKFQSLGFRFNMNAKGMISKSGVDDDAFYTKKLAPLFNITEEDAAALFGMRQWSTIDDEIYENRHPSAFSDKELWKKRVVLFLEKHTEMEAA